MAKATQITVPLTSLTVGQRGPFTSGLLPSNLTGYMLDLTNDATWPTSGDVLKISVEQSNDSGATWAFDASITLSAGPWRAKDGTVINTGVWSVGLQNQGSATRKIRVSMDVLQPCVLGAVVSSV
jgi:hypothetical protein